MEEQGLSVIDCRCGKMTKLESLMPSNRYGVIVPTFLKKPFQTKLYGLSEDVNGLQSWFTVLHYDELYQQLYAKASLEEV